jgi:outer membrane protein
MKYFETYPIQLMRKYYTTFILFFFVIVTFTSCTPSTPFPAAEDYVGPESQQIPPSETQSSDKNVPQGDERIATPVESRPVPESDTGPLKINVTDAVLLGLENNRTFIVERYNPPIQRTFEQQQRAAFDPLISGEVSRGRVRGTDPQTNIFDTNNITSGLLSVSEFLPTGTQLEVTGSTALTDETPADSSRLGLTASQSLARGFGLDVNLASLRQARLDTEMSLYELRGFAEQLVAQIEETYWDYALAQQQIGIYTQSLKIAQQQLDETQERIKVGRLAQTELAAAQSELALRQEGYIDARSALATTRLKLLRLLNPPDGGLWDRPVDLTEAPKNPDITVMDVEDYIRPALKWRPELNQAKLGVQKGDLEIVKTRNGLLPRLDLFITMGKTGFAESFGRTIHDPDERGWDWLVGLRGDWSPINRDARAQHERAVFSRRQAVESVKNLADLVQIDVRTAHIEVIRLQEQMTATAVTRKSQEETLRAETEKFRIGKSVSFLVARAQRDLLSSQIAEVQAVVNYLKAVVELYRLNGSLLQRRGIAAPGNQAVKLKDYPDL